MTGQLLKVLDMSHGLVELLVQQRVLMLKCIDVSLGLSLGLLITGITSTKLALRSIRLMWCGGWCGPTKVPHRIRKSGPATRKHGNSGRQVK